MKINFKLIRTFLFIFSVICFFVFIFSGAYLLISENDNTWLLSAAISIINFLLTSILSFINFIVLPKDFQGANPTEKFSDRKDIIQKVIYAINDKNNIIKITGHPFSGKSEFLKYLYKITTKKKYLLDAGIDKKLAEKVFKSIGCVYYIDGDLFAGEIQTFIKDIKGLSYSKRKSTVILLDNIYKLDNPSNILEILFSKKKKKIYVIYTINYDDMNTFSLGEFGLDDIYELSKKYGLTLSSDEVNNLYKSTHGNIGLISLILSNYNSQNYINQLNTVKDLEISIIARNIINSILVDTDLKKLAILCATINFYENTFNASMLSQIMGYNISILDLTKLQATGLFSQKNNVYYSSDYISQIIRSTEYQMVSQLVPKLIKYYSATKNDKAICILLLCKSKLSEQECIHIKDILVTNSLKHSTDNLGFLLKMGQAYKENNTLVFSLSEKHSELEIEIIYQYASALIYVGNYKEANEIISNNSSTKLLFMKADLAHLQNNYDDAIGLFTVVINSNSSDYQMAKIKLAHCYKHKGYFNEALTMLNNIENDECTPSYIKLRAKTDSLSLYILLKDFKGLYNKIQEIVFEISQLKNYQLATLKRYNAIFLAYENKYELAIKEINQAIDICNKSDSRLKYNCYYIRGEIYRHVKNYKQALNDFLQCYRVTLWNEDYNLKSMTVISLELIKKEMPNDIDCNIPELLKICKQKNMPYNAELLEILLQNKTLNKFFSEDIENTYFIVP